MDGYRVDPVELASVDAELAGAQAWARSALARLAAGAAPVLATAWQGGAATAFRLGWEQWLDAAQALLGALDELAAALGTSGIAYSSTEEAVRSAVRGAT